MLAKKSLGQHFLHEKRVIEDIVRTSGVTKGDRVLEIGPGEGVLTLGLLKAGANVMVIEKDQRLVPILAEKFKKEIKNKQLKLVHKDILEWSVEKIKKPYKLVANIPYYITGQILRLFLENKNQPDSMTLLVQKEVAERIVARDKKESLLSLSVKVFGTPKYIKTVGRGAFRPAPSVDSAILNIENIEKNKLNNGLNEEFFFKIIHLGFAHKRKQLLSNLSSVYKKENLLEAFKTCGIDAKVRAEDVSLEKWLKLCEVLVGAV